jgi:membrane protein implicated in regulation of membrane protease activity
MNEVSSLFLELGAWNWLILGGLFFVLELLAPGIFLIWFGVAAGMVGTAALLTDITWQWQFVMFALLSLAAVVIARKFFRSDAEHSDRPLLNLRAQQHVGKSYVVAETIENGRGKVKIGDSMWLVEGPDAKQGAQVKVTGADGTTLLVEAS